MTWQIDRDTYSPDRPVAANGSDRNCNGRYAPLMHLIARRETGTHVGNGWVRIVAERAAGLSGIKPGSVWSELQQMVKRGTLEAVNLGDHDYKVRITDAGWEMLIAEGIAVDADRWTQ